MNIAFIRFANSINEDPLLPKEKQNIAVFFLDQPWAPSLHDSGQLCSEVQTRLAVETLKLGPASNLQMSEIWQKQGNLDLYTEKKRILSKGRDRL